MGQSTSTTGQSPYSPGLGYETTPSTYWLEQPQGAFLVTPPTEPAALPPAAGGGPGSQPAQRPPAQRPQSQQAPLPIAGLHGGTLPPLARPQRPGGMDKMLPLLLAILKARQQ